MQLQCIQPDGSGSSLTIEADSLYFWKNVRVASCHFSCTFIISLAGVSIATVLDVPIIYIDDVAKKFTSNDVDDDAIALDVSDVIVTNATNDADVTNIIDTTNFSDDADTTWTTYISNDVDTTWATNILYDDEFADAAILPIDIGCSLTENSRR
uniref:Uncharacterized protein n=1 Tax=Cannabis sativa TaxID=3483 RepID=A0A803QHR7_CANSA